uniref:Cysteine-rich and transmembrane domain-containing protein 1 n=1 Tax=Xenopus tropicalis TaxID=8364 RepID=A0A6I8QMX1_XENTR
MNYENPPPYASPPAPYPPYGQQQPGYPVPNQYPGNPPGPVGYQPAQPGYQGYPQYGWQGAPPANAPVYMDAPKNTALEAAMIALNRQPHPPIGQMIRRIMKCFLGFTVIT